MRNLRLTSAAVLALAVVIAACAPAGPAAQSPSTGQPKRGGTLILARSGEVTNLDPHKVPAFTSARVFELVYSYLMRLDENLGVQPDLAASMPTTSADGKTVTVKIRTGVKFHNGDPLTSADVKYTFDRIIDPKTAAVARSFFGDVNSITAPDDSTVVFDLKTPNAALIAYMAHPNTGIVSKKIGEANADLSKKETAIGSGPFKLAEWVPDNFMRFEANKSYYVEGQPYLDGIRINVVPDESGLAAALRTKAADMAIVYDPKVARTLRSETAITLDSKPSLSYNLLFLNTKRKPFDNAKVRQAIAYAIDRKAIIDAVAFGEGEITGPIAPALTNYALPTSQYPLYTRDVAKAKQLLQEANVGPVQFTILTATTEPAYGKDEAQLVQAQLAEAGITVKIETTELTQYVDRWLKADFDMATGLNGGGPDPDFYVFRYFTDDGNLNFVTSYKNPTSSDAIKAARATTDVAKRKDLYTTAQKELVNGVPFIWLFVGRDYMATLPTTKGFTHLPTGSIIYLRQTWLDK
ncbi:MAG: ABC transporter substrate-binding protein [Chloroflexi bacterium]|nr:MAG: ABC transporter substrate-binding protein [Chloroflexota bacterium]